MAKGISVTSSIMTISGNTSEAAPNVMAEEQVPLSLDVFES